MRSCSRRRGRQRRPEGDEDVAPEDDEIEQSLLEEIYQEAVEDAARVSDESSEHSTAASTSSLAAALFIQIGRDELEKATQVDRLQDPDKFNNSKGLATVLTIDNMPQTVVMPEDVVTVFGKALQRLEALPGENQRVNLTGKMTTSPLLDAPTGYVLIRMRRPKGSGQRMSIADFIQLLFQHMQQHMSQHMQQDMVRNRFDLLCQELDKYLWNGIRTDFVSSIAPTLETDSKLIKLWGVMLQRTLDAVEQAKNIPAALLGDVHQQLPRNVHDCPVEQPNLDLQMFLQQADADLLKEFRACYMAHKGENAQLEGRAGPRVPTLTVVRGAVPQDEHLHAIPGQEVQEETVATISSGAASSAAAAAASEAPVAASAAPGEASTAASVTRSCSASSSSEWLAMPPLAAMSMLQQNPLARSSAPSARPDQPQRPHSSPPATTYCDV